MTADTVNLLESHACCGGEVRFLSHHSKELGLEAQFGLFLPRQALSGKKVPTLYVLAGLTCTQETFLVKSNAVRFAAQHGMALVAPDTSPRGSHIAGEDASYDLGTGAGYYVDATSEPWSRHYRMASYVGKELPALIERNFPVDPDKCGILGHSMGGMGALSFALSAPDKWKTVSAFAPLSSPSRADWGKKAAGAYFAGDQSLWQHYDPSLLLEAGKTHPETILVDQGLSDDFLKKLQPDILESAAHKARQSLKLRRHEGFDHSYWFVQSFIEDHINHHAAGLKD